MHTCAPFHKAVAGPTASVQRTGAHHARTGCQALRLFAPAHYQTLAIRHRPIKLLHHSAVCWGSPWTRHPTWNLIYVTQLPASLLAGALLQGRDVEPTALIVQALQVAVRAGPHGAAVLSCKRGGQRGLTCIAHEACVALYGRNRRAMVCTQGAGCNRASCSMVTYLLHR